MSLVDRAMQKDTEAEFWQIKMVGIAIFFGCGLFFFAPLIGWKCLVSLRASFSVFEFEEGGGPARRGKQQQQLELTFDASTSAPWFLFSQANYRLKTLLAKYKRQDSHRSFPASMQVWVSDQAQSFSLVDDLQLTSVFLSLQSIQTTTYTPKPTLTIIVTLPPPPGAVSTFHPDAYLPAYIQKLTGAGTNSRPSSPETNDALNVNINAPTTYSPPAGPPPPAARKE